MATPTQTASKVTIHPDDPRTIIVDSPATQIIGPPDKPDTTDWEADRERRKMRASEAKRTIFGGDAEAFEKASVYGFPAATGYLMGGWPHGGREAVYSRRQVNEWRDNLLAFAAKIK